MSIATRLADYLTPARYKRQAAQAEADLEVAREQLRKVEDRDRLVMKLWAELTAERVENHFQERVKAAYEGKEN